MPRRGDGFRGSLEIHRALNENRSDFYVLPADRQLIAQELLLFESSGSDDLENVSDTRFRRARMTTRAPTVDALAHSDPAAPEGARRARPPDGKLRADAIRGATMSLRVGFIGLGNIGKPMAARLVPAGFEAHVFDLDEAPVRELADGGAKAAGSPAELARASDVIGVCVPDDDHVRAVFGGPDGILAGAARGAIVAIHSTILPETVVEVARAADERGVAVLDACVTGGAARAAEGTLTYLVGGDADVLERARPYLESNAKTILHAGELGSGCKLKLCINLITYLQWTAAFEAMTLARAVGLPQEVLEQAGRANGQLTDLMVQYLALYKLPAEARRGEAMQGVLRGHMRVAEKDLACVLALAREAEVSLPGAALASQIMARLYAVEDEGRR